jgi:hypothetical protein
MAERALRQAGIAKPNSVPTSRPKEAGLAVIHAIQKDAAAIAIPAPAILFARVPWLGTLFLKQTGVTSMLQSLADTHHASSRIWPEEAIGMTEQ